jgi:hypothetical protein
MFRALVGWVSPNLLGNLPIQTSPASFGLFQLPPKGHNAGRHHATVCGRLTERGFLGRCSERFLDSVPVWSVQQVMAPRFHAREADTRAIGATRTNHADSDEVSRSVDVLVVPFEKLGSGLSIRYLRYSNRFSVQLVILPTVVELLFNP